MEIERSYPYAPRGPIILFTGVFGAAFTALFGWNLYTGSTTVYLGGLFSFTPRGGPMFFRVFAGLGVLMLLLSAALVVQRCLFKQRVALTAKALILPRSRWSSDELQLPYEVIQIEDFMMASQRFLKVHHPGGRIELVASMWPSMESFEEFRTLLKDRLDRR